MEQAPPTNPNHCHATRKDGQPCQAPALPDRPYCFQHDPERADERLEARRRGGRNRANIVRLRGLVPPRLQSVYDVLETALEETHSGDLSPRQATAMATVARAMVAVLQAGELEERMRDLEAQVAEQPEVERRWA